MGTTGKHYARIILRQVLLNWTSSHFYCLKEWIEGMTKMGLYERETFSNRGREDIFNQVWGSVLNYIEDMSV